MVEEFPLDTKVLDEVLNRLNMGVYVTDLERRIVVWNHKCEEITGHKREDVLGTACFANILEHVDKDGHKLCTTKFCPLYRAMMLGEETKDPILVFAKRAHGSRVAGSVSAAPLMDALGKVIGGIETFRDESGHIADLEFARTIQRHLLPRTLPQGEGFSFDARYYPHDLIGGDFYDVVTLEDGRYGFLVADVRGHGVSAALYTMWLKSLEAGLVARAGDAVAMITGLNRSLSHFSVTESFATALYGVFDPVAGTLEYCNAGHPPPLHCIAADDRVGELLSHGMPLGIVADEEYTASTVEIAPGDVLLCYTDGLTDVTLADGRMLDAAGLAEVLLAETHKGRTGLLERVYTQVLELATEVSFPDDVLLFGIGREP